MTHLKPEGKVFFFMRLQTALPVEHNDLNMRGTNQDLLVLKSKLRNQENSLCLLKNVMNMVVIKQ